MKRNYSTGITDLGHQPDHITSKRFQLFQEYGADPDNAQFFLIIIKRREIEIVGDGNKLREVKFI